MDWIHPYNMTTSLSLKERSLKHAVLSASFDHKIRAETMNARENMRLERQHRDIETFKNNVEKTYMAEKNRVKSRMQSLRRTVLSRARSIETVSSASGSRIDVVNGVHLPKLPRNPTGENGRIQIPGELDMSKSVPDIKLFCAENEQKSTHLPILNLNSPRVTRRFKIEQDNAKNTSSNHPRFRTQSHGDLRVEDTNMIEDINTTHNTMHSFENNEITLKCKGGERSRPERIVIKRKEFIDADFLQNSSRLTSRRRSLSTGDITLAERIHSFLESVENSRPSADSSDSGSNSGDEKENV